MIACVMWDRIGRPNWVYPGRHDRILEENTENVGPGDKWDEVTGAFFRPLSEPTDWPEELQGTWPVAPQAIGTAAPSGGGNPNNP